MNAQVVAPKLAYALAILLGLAVLYGVVRQMPYPGMALFWVAFFLAMKPVLGMRTWVHALAAGAIASILHLLVLPGELVRLAPERALPGPRHPVRIRENHTRHAADSAKAVSASSGIVTNPSHSICRSVHDTPWAQGVMLSGIRW